MNTKNPVSALTMETGYCYTTEVPPIENVSAENFPWNTIKISSTHVTSSHKSSRTTMLRLFVTNDKQCRIHRH